VKGHKEESIDLMLNNKYGPSSAEEYHHQPQPGTWTCAAAVVNVATYFQCVWKNTFA